ncbi:DUF4228 domain-containing protein [Quillaja saponaria]|uniref:DUF4228 domain-containing protein n=1 Tax=Quillaja saponaria TaxID=32244 RepID=A0AAD7KP39_QUISA|nr:DUF4228 domain-containing protein [Quillaja saponaria]
MGNYLTCHLGSPLMKSSKAARVIFPNGEVKQFKESIKAAELMLECPNFFLTNSRSLHIGKRFNALSADEELEFGNVYILFPMKRLFSFVTAADVAVFLMAVNSAAKRITGSGRVQVSPEASGADDENQRERQSSAEGEGQRLSLDGNELSEFQFRLSVCRSRRPNLETISEEPIYSR